MLAPRRPLGQAGFLVWMSLVLACSGQVSDIVGPSSSGLLLTAKTFFGGAGLPNDGVSQAQIRIEVVDQSGQGVTTTATLTTTLGTLGTGSLTITNGVGVTTLTSTTTVGTAHIIATVENITAEVIVPIVNITTPVGT